MTNMHPLMFNHSTALRFRSSNLISQTQHIPSGRAPLLIAFALFSLASMYTRTKRLSTQSQQKPRT